MKEMISDLKTYAKEQPKDFIMSVVLLTAVFLLFSVAVAIGA